MRIEKGRNPVRIIVPKVVWKTNKAEKYIKLWAFLVNSWRPKCKQKQKMEAEDEKDGKFGEWG